MKAAHRYILVPLFLLPVLFLPRLATVAQAQAARPWQQVTVPTTSEVAANFKAPPHEYGAISPFTGWNGADLEATQAADYGRSGPDVGEWDVHVQPFVRDERLPAKRRICRRGTWTR